MASWLTASLATVLVICALTAQAVPVPSDDEYVHWLTDAIDQMREEQSKRAGSQLQYKRRPQDTMLRFGRSQDTMLRFGRAQPMMSPNDVHLRFGKSVPLLDSSSTSLRFGRR
uniref:Short neuropeptide F n=1 Tax=Plectus sambesii TaxID=2011161 RepID=A0A914VYM1_9BILA